MSDNIIKGKRGENAAVAFLTLRGWEILERNFRTPYGEIDIVAIKDHVLVFFEVKYRTTRTFGFPETAITSTKARHMIDSAETYMQNHPELDCGWRIDVLAIEARAGSDPEIIWFDNAVSDLS